MNRDLKKTEKDKVTSLGPSGGNGWEKDCLIVVDFVLTDTQTQSCHTFFKDSYNQTFSLKITLQVGEMLVQLFSQSLYSFSFCTIPL